jgi:hypothetical protein
MNIQGVVTKALEDAGIKEGVPITAGALQKGIADAIALVINSQDFARLILEA